VAAIEGLEAGGAASTAAVLRGVVCGTDVNASSSSHPVHKDDFAMGGVAMPGLTGGLTVAPVCGVGNSFSGEGWGVPETLCTLCITVTVTVTWFRT